jgi:type IV secretory pathway TrbL component
VVFILYNKKLFKLSLIIGIILLILSPLAYKFFLKDYQQQHILSLNSSQTVLLNFIYDHLTDKSVVAAE